MLVAAVDPDLSLRAIIGAILVSERLWKAFSSFAVFVMTAKEKAERERRGEGCNRPRLANRGGGAPKGGRASRAGVRPAYRGAGAVRGRGRGSPLSLRIPARWRGRRGGRPSSSANRRGRGDGGGGRRPSPRSPRQDLRVGGRRKECLAVSKAAEASLPPS